MNESSLRKWNFNILLDHMDGLYANAVLGRAAEGVDAAHYFDDAGKAAKWDPSALTDMSKGSPIPDWINEGVWDIQVKKMGVCKGGGRANHESTMLNRKRFLTSSKRDIQNVKQQKL